MSRKSAARSRAERAAAALREQERRDRRRRLVTIVAVVAVIAVIVVGGLVVQGLRDTTGKTASSTPGGTDGYSIVVGDDSAPTTITVYEDLQCPICRELESEVGKPLNAAIDDGSVKVDYRMVSFLDRASTNEYSSRALNAALVVLDTAGVDAFKKFHDALYADQPAEEGPGPSDEELIDQAVAAGATESEVRRPIEDKVFDQWIKNATEQMSKDGVNGTPTVLVDGKPAGDTPQEGIDAIKAAIAAG
jgi:protein-disulfide isomerase